MTTKITTAATLAVLSTAALAQETTGLLFEHPLAGHVLAEIGASTPEQAELIDRSDASLFSENAAGRDAPGIYVVSPETRDRFTAAGLSIRVIHSDVAGLLEQSPDVTSYSPIVAADPFFDNFRPLNELNDFFAGLVLENPTVAEAEVIGQSWEGRDLIAYRFTGPGDASNRPAVLFNNMCHAREWISPMTGAYIAQTLAEGYGTDPRITALLDTCVVHLIPIANPDGYLFSWTPGGRLWRKTRRLNGDGTFGVDWNRNFAEGWGIGSSGITTSEVYRGTAPFSEPETQAFRDYVLANPAIAAHIDFHSFGQLVLWPWGDRPETPPEPDFTRLVDLGIGMVDAIRAVNGAVYIPQAGIDLSVAGGTSPDWTYAATGALGYTVELRPVSSNPGFILPADQIIPTATEATEAALLMAESVAQRAIATYTAGGERLTAQQDTPVSIEVTALNATSLTNPRFEIELPAQPPLTIPATPVGVAGVAGTYTATFPAAACGDLASVVFRAETEAGDPGPRVPATGVRLIEAVSIDTGFADDFEAAGGWAVTNNPTGSGTFTGAWERADPTGTAAQPENDFSPAGTLCYVTGASATSLGSNDIDNGVTILTSPSLDAQDPAGRGADLVLAYWFSNDQGSGPGEDPFTVELSADNGATWNVAFQTNDATNAWAQLRLPITETAPDGTVLARFTAQDLNAGSLVEAAIDDVRVEFAGCAGSPIDYAAPWGQLDLSDVQSFLIRFGTGDPSADLFPDGSFDLSDVQTFLLEFGTGT